MSSGTRSMSCDSQKSHLRLPFQVAFADTTIVHATKGGFPKARSLLIHTCCRMRCTWRMERSMLSRGAPGRPGLPLRSGSSWSCLRPAACVPLRRGSCQRPACGTPSNINDSERRPRCLQQHTTQGPQPPRTGFSNTVWARLSCQLGLLRDGQIDHECALHNSTHKQA